MKLYSIIGGIAIVLIIKVTIVHSQEIAKIESLPTKLIKQNLNSEYIITKKDEEKIKQSAIYTLKEFENDLNILSLAPGLDIDDVNEIIYKLYANDKRKIFYDSSTWIEDDLVYSIPNNPNFTQNKLIRQYLSDFDIYYKKSGSRTVAFTNLQTSNIKKGDYLYVKIFYDSQLGGKARFTDSAYKICKRVAEFKIERVENKWKTWISNVQFLHVNDSINNYKNDVIVKDSPEISNHVNSNNLINDDVKFSTSLKDFTGVKTIEGTSKNNEIRREEMAYKKLIEDADNFFNKNDYVAAYQKYQYAIKIKSDEDYPRTMSAFAKKKFNEFDLTQEQLYNQIIQKAKIAELNRKYEEAKDLYTNALNSKPTEEISTKVRQLATVITTIVQADIRYKAGDYKGAIKILLSNPDEKNPEFFLKAGQCYEKLNDSKTALNIYSNAIKLDPDYIEAYKKRAAIFEQNKNYQDALVDYTVCHTIDKSDLNLLIHIAVLQQLMGNLTEAKNALIKVLSLDSLNANAYLKKGEILYKENNAEAALESFNRVIKLEPENAIALIFKGVCAATLKRYTEASELLNLASKINLDSSNLKRLQSIGENCFQIAIDYYNKNRTDTAFTWINFALLINPVKEKYYYTRGEFYLRNKEFNKAISDFTEAIRINPHYDEAFKQRGYCKFQLDQYKESITDLELACRLGGKGPIIYKMLGDNYYILYNYSSAISKYDSAQILAKSTNELDESTLAELFNKKGECFYRMADYGHALENFKNSIRLNSSNAEAYFSCGKSFMQLNQLKDAEESIITAINYQPKNAFWNYILGQVYQLSSQYKNAIDRYTKAALLDTAHSIGIMPIYNRAKCYVSMKFFIEALNDYLLIKKASSKKLYAHFEAELGNIYLELFQPENAIASFKKSLTDDPLDVDAIYGMALAFIQLKQFDTAILWFEKAFSTGKIKREQLKEDQRLNDIKNEKSFKALLKRTIN